MSAADIRLLSDADATMVSKLLLDISEKNFQQRITNRTGQLYRALQQSTTQTAFAANSATLTLTPADLPGMSRPGSRSSVQRPNTSYYGPIVYNFGPAVHKFGPVTTHTQTGPGGTRSPFDFTPQQQQELTDTTGAAMASAIADRFREQFDR